MKLVFGLNQIFPQHFTNLTNRKFAHLYWKLLTNIVMHSPYATVKNKQKNLNVCKLSYCDIALENLCIQSELILMIMGIPYCSCIDDLALYCQLSPGNPFHM